MSRFLHVVAVEDAVATAARIAPAPVLEKIPWGSATGRVLAEDVPADMDIPGFDRSVVDGFAVRSGDTTGSSDATPALLQCTGRVVMGSSDPHNSVMQGTCVYIPTGGVLPAGADAVVMVEHTEETADTVLVKRPVSYGENVLLHDDDFRKGETVLIAGQKTHPAGCGSPCGSRMYGSHCSEKAVVGIISTGNELVPVTACPARAGPRRECFHACCVSRGVPGASHGSTGSCAMSAMNLKR